MSALDSYLAGFGIAKTAAPSTASTSASAYFDALGLPPENPKTAALDSYLDGLGKQADWLDFNPSQAISQLSNSTGNALSSAGNTIGNVASSIGDHAMGYLNTNGSAAAFIPRAWNAGLGAIEEGGSLRDAGHSIQQQAVNPLVGSFNQMVHGSPAPAPAPTAPTTQPTAVAPAPSVGLTPQGLTDLGKQPLPTPSLGTPATTPAAPAGPGAPGPDWLAHFKKQTGSTFNPHSVVDRMKMMGFQRGLNGGQADQASSLANRQKMIPGAGGAAANNTLLSGLNAAPGAVNLGVKPKLPGATPIAAK